ncbi:glycine cleavage system T protein [Rhizoctonia solani AG-3 Rhs1AP]|uniref:Aminomethyltransferase n=2 Tax=Rhizoctonia solani AG-3 TaxID=1086053 RepID=A0A074RX58_9AGAM|nr:glycine cleavage system T protein [Rhizoctonia solani AG-3 Rhs1AP]KEP51676.1 glycine cleavage system T protein [Rhizoctonia solani 123E]
MTPMTVVQLSRTIVSRTSRSLLKPGLPLRSVASARAFASATDAPLRKTVLYDYHVANQAKMVPFAGYSMPLQYGSVGQVASHNHVRQSVGLFDVSHMVQSYISGPSATAFLEYLTPSSLSSLSEFSSTLSVLLNENGGIIDDTVICKHANDVYYVVTNAGRRERDLAWFKEQIEKWNQEEGKGRGKEVNLEVLENWGLVALQGPKAAEVLQSISSFDFPSLVFGRSAFVDITGVRCHVARGGYTGEDGFEISIPPEHTVNITELISKPPVQPTGLGARDSLRLEAGMCLYGNDLDETTSPVEAGLSWVIGKARKEKGGFIGAGTVLKQLKEGVTRRRVGFVIPEAPAREGAKIFAADSPETQIGVITSGIPSPTLGTNIAMGYIKHGHHKKGTEVLVDVRKKLRKAEVKGMPFVPTKYWKGAAPA